MFFYFVHIILLQDAPGDDKLIEFDEFYNGLAAFLHPQNQATETSQYMPKDDINEFIEIVRKYINLDGNSSGLANYTETYG